MLEVALEDLMIRAQEAREDPTKFLAFVMRAEDTGEPIEPADHQIVMLDFLVQHRAACVLTAVDHAKTFTSAALVLWLLGHNPRLRIALLGDAEEQPKKVLKVIRTMIEQSAELRLVFPSLRKTTRDGEPWTDSDITVERGPGIKDSSVCARGLESSLIPGSRWDVAILDDFVNDENVRTPERRDWQHSLVQKRCVPRVDKNHGRIYLLSNAWHEDDSFQRHAKVWPCLTMRVDGTILIKNAPTWDSPLIRPADDRPAEDPNAEYRLIAHDPDPTNEQTLWPERFSRETIAKIREQMLPEAFAQTYMCICRDYSQSLCRPEYIAKAQQIGRELQIHPDVYKAYGGFHRRKEDVRIPCGQGLVFIGVDMAFSKQSSADESAIFTFMVLPGAIRLPLWIEHGRWGAEELEQRVLDHHERYQPSAFAVENVAAQEHVRQFLQRVDKTMPIKPYTTDAKKHNVFFGVPSIFAEFAAGAWAFPNQEGRMRPELQKFADQCLGYAPSDHTGDLLMAAYFASEMAKKFGALARNLGPKNKRIAANLMAR